MFLNFLTADGGTAQTGGSWITLVMLAVML